MSFNDILGNKAAIKILQTEIKTNRVSHAYLLSGKAGVGKKTLALQFARALLCKNNSDDSCDECIICRKTKHSNHPDLKVIQVEDDSNKIKIEQIREMQKNLVYKPYESQKKIYIVDNADYMTLPAANSLLKTLEEPPVYATIILLAEDVNRVLPTVFSRCQHIQLLPVARDKIKNFLSTRGIKPSRVELISRLAGGSPGRALKLCNDENLLQQREDILNILVDLSEINKVQIFENAEKMVKLLKEGFTLFNLLSNWYHDIIIYKQGNDKQELINYDLLEDIKQQAELYNINELSSILTLINKYHQYIEQNVKKDLALQVLLLKIRNKRV